MIQGCATLVIDLGNSSTKGKVLFGKDAKTGLFREREFEVPNVFAPIDSNYEVSEDYNTDTSFIINVDTSIGETVVLGNFCCGELQKRERPLSIIKPSATAKKYHSPSSVLSFRLAFLQACKAILAMQRATSYNQLDLTWKVVTLLPPGDVDAGKTALIDIIEDIKEVRSVFPEVVIPIEIEKTYVLPEGYCAYAGVVYDRGQVFRQDYKDLTEETVLVIDIGAGTTDILIIENNALIQNSKHTVTQGGNNVYQIVRRKLQLDGLDLSDEKVREGVVKGFVKDGSKLVEIHEYINQAKEDIAQKIISSFQDFLELTDYKIRSIGKVLVCGGGSMNDSENDKIIPLSQKIIENIKTLTPNTELIELPLHFVNKETEDGGTIKVEERISPRKLNLIGASILAEAL